MTMRREEMPWGFRIWNDEEFVGNVIRDRAGFVKQDDWSLESESLVGSWFLTLVGGDVIWQGVIVGEPAAGRYLCHIDCLEPGVKAAQRIFSLDTLMGLGDEARRVIEGAVAEGTASVVEPGLEFRLYDSEDACRAAFQSWANVKTGGAELPDAEEVFE